MTQSYEVKSVDAETHTMLVAFTQNGTVLTYNIPVPGSGETIASVVAAYWPSAEFTRRADTAAQIGTATAAIGISTDVAALSLPEIKAAQIAVLTAAAQAQSSAGYASDALGAIHVYPSDLVAQLNMTASVTDALRTPPAWLPSFAYVVGDSVMADATRWLCVGAGTSGTSLPGSAGADGTAMWASPWFTLFACTDSGGVSALRPHSALQIVQAGADGKITIGAVALKLAQLSGEVAAAADAAAVAAITWSFP